MSAQEKNQSYRTMSIKYENEPWYREIFNYINGKYAELADRMARTYQFVAPDPSINRCTHSSEFATIIREAGGVFDSTMSNLINQSSNAENFQCRIHGFLSFLRHHDPYVEERPVVFLEGGIFKYIFPFERSSKEEISPKWWIAYTDLKHNEVEAYREGNFKNALTSVAAIAILSGLIKPKGRNIIFLNIGIITKHMTRLFPIEEIS